MNSTKHQLDQIHDRLTDAGISARNISTLAEIIDIVAATQCGSVAIKALELDTQVNEAWGDRSNGNVLFAIVRQGRVVTSFLRRSTQTNTPTALRVDRIADLKDLV